MFYSKLSIKYKGKVQNLCVIMPGDNEQHKKPIGFYIASLFSKIIENSKDTLILNSGI